MIPSTDEEGYNIFSPLDDVNSDIKFYLDMDPKAQLISAPKTFTFKGCPACEASGNFVSGGITYSWWDLAIEKGTTYYRFQCQSNQGLDVFQDDFNLMYNTFKIS